MHSRFFLASAAALILALPSATLAQQAGQRADTGSAAWVVSMFYARPAFPERAAHITGEFKANYADAPTLGSRLPPKVRVSSRALLQERDRAVFATSLTEGTNAQDWYTYLRREVGVWKIEAVRTLSFPRSHYILLDTMDARRSRRALADSLLPMMETMKLAVRSDSALAHYVIAHRTALLALAEQFTSMKGLMAISIDGDVGPSGAVSDVQRRALMAALRELRLGAALHDQRSPACVFLKIGGSGDNYVGFIYAPAGCMPPPLSPTEFIYVEEVAPRWFVYKTT